MKLLPLLILAAAAATAGASERATFDSAGKLTSLVDHGATLPINAGVFAQFEGDVRIGVQPHDQRSPIARDGRTLRWSGTTTCPNSAQIHFSADWADEGGKLVLKTSVSAETPFEVQSLDYVIDLPREVFEGGRIGPEGVVLSANKIPGPLFSGTVQSLPVSTADGSWSLTLGLDQPRLVTATDTWDESGRFLRIRVALRSGFFQKGDSLSFSLNLTPVANPVPAPAVVTVEEHTARYPFDGFGGNYCFATDTPVVDYTLANLRSSWARLELKAVFWDRQRSAPGPQLKRDFDLMQRVQKRGLPWVISLWRLPERFFMKPNQEPTWTFGRRVAGDRWPELLDLIGSYLVYLKQNYGAEPDLFSFNEPDLGVSVGFSPEGHRDAIKKIGAHLASLGLKTKMLLGDTANPRDSHKFVLAAAADPEAMRYVGAVSFHSWGSGTPAQYRAWADVARWLRLPLIVGEAGTDPGSYRNASFDSYGYGLTEVQQYQELLRDSTPQALIYWQFTEDYGLVRHLPDGKIEPTGRFWVMQHFTDLTPQKSQVLASRSNQPDVLVSAFRKGDAVVVHVLNLGAERDISLEGLTDMDWSTVVTTEAEGFVRGTHAGPIERVKLPARSLTTFIHEK